MQQLHNMHTVSEPTYQQILEIVLPCSSAKLGSTCNLPAKPSVLDCWHFLQSPTLFQTLMKLCCCQRQHPSLAVLVSLHLYCCCHPSEFSWMQWGAGGCCWGGGHCHLPAHSVNLERANMLCGCQAQSQAQSFECCATITACTPAEKRFAMLIES